MSKPLRVKVSEMAFDEKCLRKPYMEALLHFNEIVKEVKENKYLIYGKILHEILQSTFTYDFSLVKYFYFKKNMDIQNSLKNCMLSLSERWKSLLDSPKINYPWYKDFDMKDHIKTCLDAEIPVLSKLSQSLIFPLKDELMTYTIGTEYELDYFLNEKVSLIGKIDLLAWTENLKGLRIIELKTGSQKNTSDKSQVGTYAEIIRKEFPQFEIIPEVWYTKNNKRGKIRYLSDFSASDLQLDRAKSVINNIVNINSEDDLPVMASNYKTCEFCNLCTDYMDLIFKPEKKEESKNSLFKFL